MVDAEGNDLHPTTTGLLAGEHVEILTERVPPTRREGNPTYTDNGAVTTSAEMLVVATTLAVTRTSMLPPPRTA